MSEQSGSALSKHDADVNGTTLRYITWGEPRPAERAVLLIHGITASHRYWATAGPALAERGWYVIAPDLRGRGLSGKPPHGYGIALHANDLLALCDELGLETVNVVGHSLGAQVALFLAALYPGRVSRLVMVDGGGKTPPDALDAVASSVKRLGNVYPSLDGFLAALRQAAPFPWTPFWEEYYRYDVEVRPDGTVTPRMSRTAFDEEWVQLLATRTESFPSFVKAPTLIVRAWLGTLARDSGFVLPPEEAERMHATIAGSRMVVIPETNHYTVNLVPDFVRTVAAFLAEGRPGA